MNIQVEKDYFNEHMLPLLPQDSSVIKQAQSKLRYGSTRFDLDVSMLDIDALDGLYAMAQATENRSMMVQLAPMQKVIRSPKGATVTSLKALSMGLISLMRESAIDGWLYHIGKDKVLNPYLITQVVIVEPKTVEDRAYVRISLQANNFRNAGEGTLSRTSLNFDTNDIHKKTLPEILASQGFYLETPELKAIYEEYIQLFEEYQPQFNKQFISSGLHQPSTDHYGYNDSAFVGTHRVVNDEGIVNRKYQEDANPEFWRKIGVKTGFEKLPFHTYIRVFNLSVHQSVWVHVSTLKPYKYDKTVRNKLILPQSHRDLIDILVEDMDILQEDIVQGKSGGTTILCTGSPGLGKTLSAEVYSEIIERPLYRVHSGQLGLNATSVEKNLEQILKRAARWGAVLLLDEADVYIRNRGNDLEHNAVVASFLRTLEYFNGLMFMTTNRGDDVDDAILSRCIAVIQYETPSKNNAERIWSVLSTQFGVALSPALISDLVTLFPSASGRDIKELLKLSSRFARGKAIDLDLEVFRKCAQFRGLSMTTV